MVFLLIFLGQVVLANPIKVTNFRFAIDPAKTRLVFDTTAPVNYAVVATKDQIVIDIKKAKLTAILNKTRFVKTPINSILSTQNGSGLHLVLALKKPVKLKHFLLSKPTRLVLDLYSIEKVNSDNSVGASKNEVRIKEENPTKDEIQPQVVSEVEITKRETNKINGNEGTIQNAPNSVDFLENLEQDLINNSTYKIENKDSGGERDVVVVIDPGHGGKDPGAIGTNGTREKDVTLAVAKALQNLINETKGFRAVLTRNSDFFVPLRERLGIAHSRKADMFISIHADAYKNSTAHGASVFALSQRGATSEAARWLAEKENESELGQAMVDKNALLRSVLIDLAQTAAISSSLEIGGMILQNLKNIAHLHSKHVEQAAFVVLKSPDIPSLLVEVGFLSYGYEESKLRDAEYQNAVAEKLAAGIRSYFIRRPPMNTYLAKMKRKALPTMAMLNSQEAYR